jgi:uncharacterized membrane protein
VEPRPEIKIELSKADKVLEAFCLILLIVLWLGTAAGYSKLPDQIPIHFNGKGNVDAFGHKIKIFTLPGIATFLYVIISLLNRYPYLYNYPSTINFENAERLYTGASKLMRVMKFIVIFIFTMVVAMTYRSVLSNNSGLGTLFLPTCIALLLLPTIFYFFKGIEKKAANN